MSRHNFFEHEWDFRGQDIFSVTAADNAPFLITDTSAAGSPTYAIETPSSAGSVGGLAVTMAATNEIENLCVSQNDNLQYLIGQIIEVEFRLKMAQATLNAASMFAFGLTSARNDTIASLTNSCLFRLVGASNVVKIDTRDGTVTNNGVSTNQTLANAFKNFRISFATGKKDIRFFVDDVPAIVPAVSAFDMSNTALGLQIFLQIQKTAATPTDGFVVDYIRIAGRRY
jgi:hypothetical protein